MKSKFVIVAFALLMGLASCTEEEKTEFNESLDLTTETTVINNGSDSVLQCVNNNLCNPNVIINTLRPSAGILAEFTITYDASMTLAEIDCVRRGYFSCILELYMNEQQPPDSHTDSWLVRSAKPSQTTSTTIDDDPRVTADTGNTGG